MNRANPVAGGPGAATEWVTVAQFRDLGTAALARGRLQAEGIEAELQDHHTVAINWLYSNAVGGVKLRVRVEDADEGRGILGLDHRQDLEEATGHTVEEPQCPRCGSERQSAYDPKRILAALTLLPYWPLVLVAGFPFIRWRARRRCLGCGKAFRGAASQTS